MNKILECRNLAKVYKEGLNNELIVLKNLDFSLNQGEQVAIIGRSGSGKSTLLHLLGGLDIPSSGEVLFKQKSWVNLNETERGELRNLSLSFIYQFHHLLAEFSALENVMLPLLMRKDIPLSIIKEKSDFYLEKVGLQNRLNHKPAELSGGERQRVAIARALVTEPDLILADEPTGNLDSDTAQQVFNLMQELNQTLGTALITVTHDNEIAKRMSKQYVLHGGRLRTEVG